jgi:hypothetical protein
MPRLQRKAPPAPRRPKQPRLPRATEPAAPGAPAKSRKSQADAIRLLLDGAAERGEGKRILLLGATRKGKTTFAKKLIVAMLEQGVCHVALIHDLKYPDHAQYTGPEAHDVAKLRELVLLGHKQIVCRHGLSIEDVASVQREMVENKIRVAVLADETMPCLKVNEETAEPMNRIWAGPTPVWTLLQGGGLGASWIHLVQIPQTLPTSLVDSAEAYVFFALGGRSLRFAYGELRLLPQEAVEPVSIQAPGECALFIPDAEWDHVTYGPN